MHTTALQVIPAELTIPQFGILVPVMRVPGMGDYFPVRAFCRAIGLARQAQLERIQNMQELQEAIETFTIPTAGGPQETICLRKAELAWWLGTLEPRTIRKLEERFSTTLEIFKRELMDAADRMWWGVSDQPHVSRALQVQPHGAIFLHCRRCHARHRLEMLSDMTFTWEIDEE
jgi:P22_AR N-terminal domain